MWKLFPSVNSEQFTCMGCVTPSGVQPPSGWVSPAKVGSKAGLLRMTGQARVPLLCPVLWSCPHLDMGGWKAFQEPQRALANTPDGVSDPEGIRGLPGVFQGSVAATCPCGRALFSRRTETLEIFRPALPMQSTTAARMRT